jgi:hypothetical protein
MNNMLYFLHYSFEIPFTLMEKFRGHNVLPIMQIIAAAQRDAEARLTYQPQVTDHNAALLSSDNIHSHILKTYKKLKICSSSRVKQLVHETDNSNPANREIRSMLNVTSMSSL